MKIKCTKLKWMHIININMHGKGSFINTKIYCAKYIYNPIQTSHNVLVPSSHNRQERETHIEMVEEHPGQGVPEVGRAK